MSDSDESLQGLVRCRKRRRQQLSDIRCSDELTGKRICLVGEFALYRREGVVDALRRSGARVYIHPSPQRCSMAVVGNICSTPPPPLPYITEAQLLQFSYWNQRLQIVLPWYQHFEPRQLSQLIDRQTEAAAVRNWLHKQHQKAGALLLYGDSGYGKKCLAKAALRDAGMTVILDACAVCDASLKDSPNAESISTLSARLPMCDAAVMIFNADSLCTTDAKLLVPLIKKQRAAFVFLISSNRLNKKSAFWRHIAPLCSTKLQLKPLHKSTIVDVLRRVCDQAGETADEGMLRQLATYCEGDLRHALINLECKLRLSTRDDDYRIDYKESTQEQLLNVLSVLTHPKLPMQLRQFQIDRLDTDLQLSLENALHATSSYKSLDDAVRMTQSLSDCDGFYHKKVTQDGDISYRTTIPALTAAACLNPMRSVPRTAFLRSSKPQIREALAESDLNARQLCSAATTSPETLSVNLLAAYPKLLAPTDDASSWLLPPKLLRAYDSTI